MQWRSNGGKDYMQDIQVNPLYLKGTLRLMWYEHWQRLGVSNTYQLTTPQKIDIPRSIADMRETLENTVGYSVLHDWELEIQDDFDHGHRA
jgi:hypothetical protein